MPCPPGGHSLVLMAARIRRLRERLAPPYETRTVQADGRVVVQRHPWSGVAANAAHDAAWAGPVGARSEVWRRGRRGHLVVTFRRIAGGAVERSDGLGARAYEYSPSPQLPAARLWSPVWPPRVIPYQPRGADAGVQHALL